MPYAWPLLVTDGAVLACGVRALGARTGAEFEGLLLRAGAVRDGAGFVGVDRTATGGGAAGAVARTCDSDELGDFG